MLPWGLYALDQFVIEEAGRRSIPYAHEINRLAYLVDAGVPDGAALRLTVAGFERADAARLSNAYFSSREAKQMTDIFRWVSAQSDGALQGIISGPDPRPLDYEFFPLLWRSRFGGSQEWGP